MELEYSEGIMFKQFNEKINQINIDPQTRFAQLRIFIYGQKGVNYFLIYCFSWEFKLQEIQFYIILKE